MLIFGALEEGKTAVEWGVEAQKGDFQGCLCLYLLIFSPTTSISSILTVPSPPRTPDASSQQSLETHTPNIDKLYEEGIELDRHYTYKICSPSRSALQSGRHPDHVNPLNTGVLVNNPDDPVSGYQGIPRNMTGIAEKLKSAGYKTHIVGKWDAGMATPDHTPRGRGYDSFYGYFQHANGYWDKGGHIESTGDIDLCMNVFTDLFMENETYRGGVLESGELDESCSGSNEDDPSCYEEHIFKAKTLDIINAHDTSSPLFHFHAFHLIHTPLEVPNSYLDKVDAMIAPFEFDDAARRNYSAMVYYMDEVVGEIVDALKAKDMWDNTVLALMADNGGPLYVPGSGNNHPLKGGKYSDWEGGVRTNALISGGSVPEASRGGKYDGLVSIADWYGMFTELANVPVDDEKAERANVWLEENNLPTLPPVDSVPGLYTSITSLKSENLHPVLPLSDQAIIKYPYKLITGIHPYSNWTGELYPNCTTISDEDLIPWHNDSNIFEYHIDWDHDDERDFRHVWGEDCGIKGCLFNIEEDPNETNNLSGNGKNVDLMVELMGLLEEHRTTLFTPNRGVEDVKACENSITNGGFYGPWIDTEEYYTGPFREISFVKKVLSKGYAELLELVAHPKVEETVWKITEFIYPCIVRPYLERDFDWCCTSDGCPQPPKAGGENGSDDEGLAGGHDLLKCFWDDRKKLEE